MTRALATIAAFVLVAVAVAIGVHIGTTFQQGALAEARERAQSHYEYAQFNLDALDKSNDAFAECLDEVKAAAWLPTPGEPVMPIEPYQ